MDSLNPSLIFTLLENVRDPLSGVSLVQANMVKSLEIRGHQINFELHTGNLQGEQKSNLHQACVLTILDKFPEADIHIHFVQVLPQDQRALPHIKNIIAVASGKGGVGKSTISVNLAISLHKLGARVGLIDADLYGPSIPTMLGISGQKPKMTELYGAPKILPIETYGIPVISIGLLLEPEQAVVLRGPRLSAIIKQFFNDILWPELDYLIVDLPPGTGDIQLSLVQTVPVTGVVLVTTPQEVALADAIKAMNMFLLPQIDVPILGVIENMSWFTPAELPDHKYFLFGKGGGAKLAKMSDSVLLGQVPIYQSIREGGDEGKPVATQHDGQQGSIFMDIAKRTVEQVAWRHELIAPSKKVQMS
jgi:ATP-binding protein involved in chromosome partitioning